MPKIRTRGRPPQGWEDIEPLLEALEERMREAVAESHEGKRRAELTRPILRINHQRSRLIYDLYYKKQEISKELYDFCLKEKLADANLIAKWKKPGYENLCCLRCNRPQDTNFGTVCICRVPKAQVDDQRVIECDSCGCGGCSG